MMIVQKSLRPLGCVECASGNELSFRFSMAFQPIVNITSGEIFAQEALVRGLNNEPAGSVFQHVNATNRYLFDQTCRVKAVRLASQLGMTSYLSINFMPNAVYRPEMCIRTTLSAAKQYGFPISRMIFEITESEKVDDVAHMRNIVEHYKQQGFLTALDDFGAGYAGLNLLADVQTDLIKLDMDLIRNIHKDRGRRAIVKGIGQVCQEMGIRVIAEGIEQYDEMATLRDLGFELLQGYYFARPTFEALPTVSSECLAVSQ